MINSPYNMLGVKKVEDPRQFGVAEIDINGFIEHVVEKPSIPKSNMALVGLYKIKETEFMYSCLHHLFTENIKTHGEYSFTDALDFMIKRGACFKSFKVKDWFDCGKKDTLLESNAILLKKSGGNVKVHHQYKGTIIIPPVSIAPNCTINDSIIGPHVAIGANTNIKQSIVRESIIGSYTNLYDVVLDNSLIGSDASVKGLSRSLNIGDNTEIEFG
jgi:glucose-1-phosphate thymidylyltransferase